MWGFTGFKRYLLTWSGINLGQNVEVAGPVLPNFQIPFNFIKLEDSSTLTSAVWIGEERWENGVWRIEKVIIGHDAFVGDTGTVVAGRIPNNSIVSSVAVVHDCPKDEFSVCVGNPSNSDTYRGDK